MVVVTWLKTRGQAVAPESRDASTKDADAAADARSLVLPCLLVFTSGFSVMLIELCASRMAVAQIGHSIYTWTAVLGVILDW